MTTLFFADKDFEKVITRKRAKGYKSLVIDDNVEVAKPVKTSTFTDENGVSHLKITKSDEPVNENQMEYMFLVKEIGAVPTEAKATELEIIFLDNGWMLVTLKKGAIAVKLNENVTIPTLNYNLSNKITVDTIKWLNLEDFISTTISYNKYNNLDAEGTFVYDYIYNMCVKSTLPASNGVTYTYYSTNDISLGAIALYQQNKAARERGVAFRKQYQTTMQAISTPTEYDDEYDDDEYDDDDGDYSDLAEYL